jgi:hypothetical protein
MEHVVICSEILTWEKEKPYNSAAQGSSGSDHERERERDVINFTSDAGRLDTLDTRQGPRRSMRFSLSDTMATATYQ